VSKTNNNTQHFLAQLLSEANFDDWESVASISQRTGPRSERLLAHITETKQLYWRIISEHCQTPAPPSALLPLLQFEVEQVQQLSLAQLEQRIEYSGRDMDIAALIRLSARHTVWHAGQIALTALD
jgi:hypothetical protein